MNYGTNNICSYVANDSMEVDILNICRCEYNYFLNKKNVNGVGLGYKEVKGSNTYEKCIKVLVVQKCPKCSLNSCDIIPDRYKGIKTDVEAIGHNVYASLTDRVRPVIGGYSIGVNDNIAGGTYGGLVVDNNGIYYMLSCNHVLAKNRLPIGTTILQPAYMFGGRAPEDIVANLANYVPIRHITPTERPENLVDCAIAEVVHPNIASAVIAIIGVPKGVATAKLGETVKKVGKTTELTLGAVRVVGATLVIRETTSTVEDLFIDQIVTSPLCEKGDSGSLLLNLNDEVVGLVMSTATIRSASNPIINVLNALKVNIVTQ